MTQSKTPATSALVHDSGTGAGAKGLTKGKSLRFIVPSGPSESHFRIVTPTGPSITTPMTVLPPIQRPSSSGVESFNSADSREEPGRVKSARVIPQKSALSHSSSIKDNGGVRSRPVSEVYSVGGASTRKSSGFGAQASRKSSNGGGFDPNNNNNPLLRKRSTVGLTSQTGAATQSPVNSRPGSRAASISRQPSVRPSAGFLDNDIREAAEAYRSMKSASFRPSNAY